MTFIELSLILGILFPLVHIDEGSTIYQHFNFIELKNREDLFRDEPEEFTSDGMGINRFLSFKKIFQSL